MNHKKINLSPNFIHQRRINRLEYIQLYKSKLRGDIDEVGFIIIK